MYGDPRINLDRFQGAVPDVRDDTFYCTCCGRVLDIDYLKIWNYQPDGEGICIDCWNDVGFEEEEQDEEEGE